MIHIKSYMVSHFARIISDVCGDVSILSAICLVSHDPISNHWSLPIPPENIRKLWFSDVFKGYRKRPVA